MDSPATATIVLGSPHLWHYTGDAVKSRHSVSLSTGAQPHHPIATLLEHLKNLKRVYLEPEEANTALAHMVAAVVAAHPRLAPDLVRFGWSHGLCQTALDVRGFASCLKKYKYEKQAQLGSGSYGVVFKARDIETHELLAIKKLAAKYEDDCGLPDSTMREITTLTEMKHPNVVQ